MLLRHFAPLNEICGRVIGYQGTSIIHCVAEKRKPLRFQDAQWWHAAIQLLGIHRPHSSSRWSTAKYRRRCLIVAAERKASSVNFVRDWMSSRIALTASNVVVQLSVSRNRVSMLACSHCCSAESSCLSSPECSLPKSSTTLQTASLPAAPHLSFFVDPFLAERMFALALSYTPWAVRPGGYGLPHSRWPLHPCLLRGYHQRAVVR